MEAEKFSLVGDSKKMVKKGSLPSVGVFFIQHFRLHVSAFVAVLSAVIKRVLMFYMLILAMPALGVVGAELNVALVDQRIADLIKGGVADSDERLKSYQHVKSWLTSAALHKVDAAKYISELTEAPRREARIQARLDINEPELGVVETLGGLSVQALKTELTLTQTALRDARDGRDGLDRQLAARESKGESIRQRLNEISTRLEAIPSYGAVVDPAAAPSITEAGQWLLLAEQMSLREERREKVVQLNSQPVRYSVLNAQRAELHIKIDKLTQRAKQVTKQLRDERLTADEPQSLDLASDSPVYSLGQRYQTDNALLSEQSLMLESNLAEVESEQQMVERATRVLNERFVRARRVVGFATESDALGQALLAYWEELNKLKLEEPRKEIPRQVGDVVISRIQHEESLSDLVSSSAYLNKTLNKAGLNPTIVAKAEREVLLELLLHRRELLRNIISTESDFIDTLSELQANYKRHNQNIAEYQKFLDPLVFWVPSGGLFIDADFKQIPEQIGLLLRWVVSIKVSPNAVFFCNMFLALIFLVFRTRLRDFQHVQNKQLLRPYSDGMHFTLVALFVSALRAAPLALMLAGLVSMLSVATDTTGVNLAAGLYHLVIWFYVAKLLNTLCEEKGVARSHFHWGIKLCDRLQRESTWFIRWLLPGLVFGMILYRPSSVVPLLGRVVMLTIALLIILHLVRNLVRVVKEGGRGKLSTYENRIQLILAVLFVVLAIGVVFGLRLSVGFVTRTLMDTIASGFLLAIGYSFLLRWLRIARRNLRFKEILAAREARSEQPNSEITSVEEDQIGLAEISDETQQLLKTAAIVVGFSILYYLWTPILPLFDALSSITLWTSTAIVEGESTVYQVSLDVLIFVVLLISITVYAARKLPALVELVLRARTDVSAGTRYTVSTLMNYVILGTGILVSLSWLGLDWSKLQWLVAALGVGIGFGLQEIVANFISGLIILFERPISVGDIITVGEQDGVVTRIRIRATTIRDWDNKELLIPNKEIITGRLLNWSLSDTNLRVSVPVGISYGSDVELAFKILDETIADDARIMKDPEPSIIFKGFGDSSLDLVCRFYIDDLDYLWPVKTSLHLEIYRRFEEAGIVISFPQRDVHLDSEKPFRISIDPGPAT